MKKTYKINIENIRVIFFFLFVLSGKFAYEIFNVELQARYFILMAMIVVCVDRNLMYNKFRINGSMHGVIVFCLILISSAGWNIEGSYVLEYISDLILLLFAIFYLAINLRNDDRIFLFLSLFEKTALIYSILSIASVLIGERGLLLLGGPNVTVRIIFLGLLCYTELRKNRNYNYLIIFILVAGIISTGSRGGMISSLICIMLYMAHRISLNSLIAFTKISLIGLIKIFIFCLSLLYIYDNFRDQIDSLISSRITETLVDKFHLAGRDVLLMSSLNVISENIYFGKGLSSYYDNEVGFHPHNLFVQLYLDLGLFSIINIAIIFYALKSFVTNRKSFVYYAIPFFLIAHLVSGSYYDLRYMFLFWILGETINKKFN